MKATLSSSAPRTEPIWPLRAPLHVATPRSPEERHQQHHRHARVLGLLCRGVAGRLHHQQHEDVGDGCAARRAGASHGGILQRVGAAVCNAQAERGVPFHRQVARWPAGRRSERGNVARLGLDLR